MQPPEPAANLLSAGAPVLVRSDRQLVAEINRLSDTDLNLCLHCRSCGNGCPFVEAMDYPPNAIIRLLQYGMLDLALKSSTIWICVACSTCSSQCPMSIDIPAIMDALRCMALEKGATVAQPNILDFHREVLNSIERYGRVHKLGVMLRYKVLTGGWLTDMDLGLRMLGKRKLELWPSKMRAMGEITRLFHPSWK